MAFPNTPILDNFNRADENPLGNGTWGGPTWAGHAAGKLVSNVASAPPGVVAGSYWTPVTPSGDTEVYATQASSLAIVYLYLHWNPVPNSGYQLVSGHGVVSLYKVSAGTQTLLASYSGLPTSGSAYGLARVGSTLQAYANPSSGSWAALGTAVTDATYTSGRIGFEVGTSDSLDDFGGGALPGGRSLAMVV